MIETILKVDGMVCGMCESHINDTVRNRFPVQKVTSSHTKGETVILSPEPLDEQALHAAIAFGCPAMGSEVLEEMEFQPMFDACKNCLGGKAVALFGSYGWGDGEWMRSWEKDCADAGINLVCDSVTCCEAPDDAALDALRAMGKTLAA